jgi:hypothetical protein
MNKLNVFSKSPKFSNEGTSLQNKKIDEVAEKSPQQQLKVTRQ